MKDYANPLLLFLVVVLFALSFQEMADESRFDPMLWLLVFCVTGCMVNGLLCIARSLAHRPVLMSAVWSMAFLVLGCMAWMFVSQGAEGDRELTAGYTALKTSGASFDAPDESGECLLTYAAALGKKRAVATMAESAEPAVPQELWGKAAARAAARGHVNVLQVLVPAKAAPDAVCDGMPLLVTAAVNGRVKAVQFLLEQGAAVNAADAEGNTALIHAAVNDDVPMAKLLLQHGADKAATNAAGQTAADNARGEVADVISPESSAE